MTNNSIKEALLTKQKYMDEEYPEENKTDYGVSVSRWRTCLRIPRIITKEQMAILKKIYLMENHTTSLKYLESRAGVEDNAYAFELTNLAMNLSKALDLEILTKLSHDKLWTILFWGKKLSEDDYELKLKPELVFALEILNPEFILENGDKLDELRLRDDMGNTIFDEEVTEFKYNAIPVEKKEPVLINGYMAYPRDLQVAKNALLHAHYTCELDVAHPTFVRPDCRQGYFETFHIVPMKYSDRFDVSLDVEENILSVCSNCNNQLKYGIARQYLLETIYKDRKYYLDKAGINITLEELLGMYGLNDSDDFGWEDINIPDYDVLNDDRS